MMDFTEALHLMRNGHTLTRAAWDDPKQVTTFEGGKLKKVIACQVAHYTHAKLGWNPHINDILAEDWRLVK